MASILKVDTLQKPDGSTPTAADLGVSVTHDDLPSGSVVQVVSNELTGRVVYNQQSFGDIGFEATITPKYADSRILVSIYFGRIQTRQSTGDHGAAIRLLRNGVDSDLNGAAEGSRPRSLFVVGGWSFNADHLAGGYGVTGFDNPATTSPVTYKLQAFNQSSAIPLYINGNASNTDNGEFYNSRTKAFITLQEIKA